MKRKQAIVIGLGASSQDISSILKVCHDRGFSDVLIVDDIQKVEKLLEHEQLKISISQITRDGVYTVHADCPTIHAPATSRSQVKDNTLAFNSLFGTKPKGSKRKRHEHRRT